MDGRLRSAGPRNIFQPFSKPGIQESSAARAIAETLFGDNNPAGRLTITFPRSVGQLPDFYNSDPSRVHKYVDDDGKPLFPFGFGLSYTTLSLRRSGRAGAAAGKQGRYRGHGRCDEYRRRGKAMRWRSSMCGRTSSSVETPDAVA